ncbi:MAG: IS1 family transposase [Alphaproteobacteria bacterium]|nr:IS1 family transposase [Alphaproteobacteria bacterium]
MLEPGCAGSCGGGRTSIVKNEKPQPYRCKGCRKFFSVRTGTIFENSKLEFRKCLYAILDTGSKKGISSCQLARKLGVTQKTAWFMAQRIRESYGMQARTYNGTIEVDETRIGGKDEE